MKKIKIGLDPGHGGNDPGAIGPTGLFESHVALIISNKVRDILIRHGIEVALTRQGDVRVERLDRAVIANKAKVDYFVSIHINSATNPVATGTETFAVRKGTEGDRLAKAIQNNLVKEINLPDRGVKYANFTVITQTNMPAALVEVAFINNVREEKLLRDDTFLDKAATGIARGILEHIGVDYMTRNNIVEAKVSNLKYNFEGQDHVIDTFNINNSNHVPIRLLEKFGFNIRWEPSSQTAFITKL